MAAQFGKARINSTADAAWGAHSCVFYRTTQDLFDTLIPFFNAGLKNNEACVWIISPPLTETEVRHALEHFVPDLDQHLKEQRIELFFEGTDSRHNFGRLRGKLAKALAGGYSGLRIARNTNGPEKCDLAALLSDKNGRHKFGATERVRVLCTYRIANRRAGDLLDAMHAHQVSATIQKGGPGDRANPSRTAYANEELRREIDERKCVEDELRNKKEALQKIFDHIPVMINFMDPQGRTRLANPEWERTLGWTLDEIQQHHVDIVAECFPSPDDQQQTRNFISSSDGEWKEFKIKVRDGRVLDTIWAVIRLSDGTSIAIGRDITERKQWEERLRINTEQLRELTASIQTGREDERSRVARSIHDELGSVLTGFKWELEALDQTLSKPLDTSTVPALKAKIAGMLKLADTTINTVRRIAWELRPSILDDLGLVEAIEWQIRQFETRTGIICRRQNFLDNVTFNGEQSTAIFRIFQEALTNILRHAKARSVDITMTREQAEFVLAISDDGGGIKGFVKSGLGILGMRERARLVGGKIYIHGLEGAGTTIALRVPIASQMPGPQPKL